MDICKDDNPYKKIGELLRYYTEIYHLQICIKDFYGFIPGNKALDQVLQPYLAHTNSFCMYMKSSTASYHRCLKMIRKMYEKIEKENCEYFYGTCHAGLGEYVIPIRYEKTLLGSINIGFFQKDPIIEFGKMKHTCEIMPLLHFDYAKQLYNESIETPAIRSEELLPTFFLLAEYLGHTHEILAVLHPELSRFRYSSSNEDDILSHALNFINMNYYHHISVDDLASFAHCSPSYLSHIFKKRTEMNINSYINRVRIDHSKEQLEHATSSIATIALDCGFEDPNYYSKIFTNIMGISPREY